MFSPWTIEFLRDQIGKPYIYGGANPMVGWDCSGLWNEALIIEGLLAHGTDLSAQGLYDRFSLAENGLLAMGPIPGALAFYGDSKKSITHVAGFVDYKRVLTASGGDHTTTTLEEAIKKNAWVKLRVYNYRKDLVAIVSPNPKP